MSEIASNAIYMFGLPNVPADVRFTCVFCGGPAIGELEIFDEICCDVCYQKYDHIREEVDNQYCYEKGCGIQTDPDRERDQSLKLDGWHRVRTHHPKIFQKGGLLIGSEQAQRVSDIIEYNLDLPADSGMAPDAYLGSTFIPALRACLQEHGGLNDGQMEAVIMIGYRGGLFIVKEV